MNDGCLCKTSIGKKLVVAVTGLMLVGFVIGHLFGNFAIFLGQDALNAYAKKLRDLGPLLWVARLGLLGAVLAHLITGLKLCFENKKARPVPYQHKAVIQTTLARRSMAITGLIILGFIIYHLLHFTFKTTHPEISHLTDAKGYHDVYSMVVLSFQQWPISAIYLVSLTGLFLHLSHGLSSLLQTLGFYPDGKHECLLKAGQAFAFLLYLGYISIPLAVLFGMVKPVGGVS